MSVCGWTDGAGRDARRVPCPYCNPAMVAWPAAHQPEGTCRRDPKASVAWQYERAHSTPRWMRQQMLEAGR